MPKSPTLEKISDAFKKIKERLNTQATKNNIPKKIYYSLLFYPIIVLCILIYIKPKIILQNDRNTILSKKDSYTISYPKLMLWFLLLQLPLILYIFLSNLKL